MDRKVLLTRSGEEGDLVETYEPVAGSSVREPVELGKLAEAIGQLGLRRPPLNQRPHARR